MRYHDWYVQKHIEETIEGRHVELTVLPRVTGVSAFNGPLKERHLQKQREQSVPDAQFQELYSDDFRQITS